MNYTIDDVKNDLKMIGTGDKLFNRMIKVAAIITKYMEQFTLNKHGYPIIVGGLSMEIYTHSEYTTHDIDFVSSSSELLRDLLLCVGFVEEGRIYFYDELNVAVDIVATALDPMNYDDLVRIELVDGSHVYSISIEAILYDRALSYDYADTENYCIYLIINQFNEIDFNYVRHLLANADEEALKAFNTWVEIAERAIKGQYK